MRPRLWLSYLVLGGLVAVAYFQTPASLVGTLLYDGLAISAALTMLASVHSARLAEAQPWRWLALGLLLFAAGDLAFPASLADALYLAGYPCLTIGLLLLLRCHAPGHDRAALLDAAILTVAVAAPVWVLLMAPYAADVTLDQGAQFVALAYPAADLALLAVAVRLALAGGWRAPAARLLGFALAAVLVADILYGLAQLGSGYAPGDPMDALYLASYLAFGAAALHPSRPSLTTPAPLGPDRPLRGRLVALGAVALVGPALLVIGAMTDRPAAVPVVVGAATLLFVLALVRIGELGLRLEAALTRSRAAEAELAHRAVHDALTELPNRALFRDRLGHALARSAGGTNAIAVLFVDLDDFKLVNDGLGHAVGDALLTAVAQRLQAALDPADTVARLGGDEFAVLLEDLADAPAAAEQAAERIVAALRPALRLGGQAVAITPSIGVATATPGDSVEDLLRRADVAMYAAKRDGKARHVRFEPGMDERVLGPRRNGGAAPAEPTPLPA